MNFYTFFPKLLNMSLTGTVAIICVLLLRLLLKKAPKVISYALWAIVLFRLLCPVSIESGLSLFGLMEAPTVDTVTGTNSIQYVPENIVHMEVPAVMPPAPGVSETINSTLQQGKEQAAAKPIEIAVVVGTYVWLAGVLAMAVYSVASYFKLKKRLLTAYPLQENIYLVDEITTPFVMGLFRPRIYLPSDIEKRQMSYIIFHEKHHIQRGDHIWKGLAFLALSIHWFNPFAWLAFLCAGKDMEMSCDEAVVKKLGAEILADYTASLLSLATGKHIIAGVPLAFGEGDTKGRILNLARWKKPTFWVVLVAVIACVALSITLLTNPEKVKLEYDEEENISTVEHDEEESKPVIAKWTFSPMMSATWHAAFHFDFKLDYYSHIEASCDNGTLWNLSAQGQPQEKEIRFEQGEPLCWTPMMEGESHLSTAEAAKINFTVFDGEEIVGSGVLDIVRTGAENGQSFYEAQLTDTEVLALWQEEGSFVTHVIMAGNGVNVAYSDLNHNRINERIVVREVYPEMLYELLVVENGRVIWSTEAGLPHVGWSTIMLYHEGGLSYLVEYQPHMVTGIANYRCRVFSLEDGTEKIKEEYAVGFEVPVKETPEMDQFARDVDLLLRNCTVLLSTEDGILVTEPVDATDLPQIYPVRFDPDEIQDAIDGTTNNRKELTSSAADYPVAPLKLMFASGAGGWGSILTLQPDGSFNGECFDSEMGTMALDYPNGTCYVSMYEGQFLDIQQISDYSWSMKLTELSTEKAPKETWIEGGIRYIASDAYGVTGGEEFILYAPGTLADDLPAECRSWWPDVYSWRKGKMERLEGWCLYNVNTGQGFFTSWLEAELGMVSEQVTVTGTPLLMAEQVVSKQFAEVQDLGYTNWRIDSLTEEYVYDSQGEKSIGDMRVSVYQLGYSFLGVSTEYTDTYLCVVADGGAVSYVVFDEKESTPGDDAFTEKLKVVLGVNSSDAPTP